MQQRSSLERRYSLGTLFVLTLFAVIGVSAFTPSNADAKIAWTPSIVEQTLMPGSTYTTTVAFSSSDSFANATLSFTPRFKMSFPSAQHNSRRLQQASLIPFA